MNRPATLRAVGIVISIGLSYAACLDDAPTGNPTHPSTVAASQQSAPQSSTVRSVSAQVVPDVIYACVNSSSGTIKIVSVTDECAGNEESVSWNREGPVGPQGTPGPQGPAGLPGPAGSSGISGYQIVSNQSFLSPGVANVHVECPSGKKVLGGGFSVETPTDVRLYSSEPSDGSGNLIDHGWNLFVQNAGALTRQVTVIAICATVQ